MSRMGFKVLVFINELSAADVLRRISDCVLRGDQADCNAFGLAFMSHGDKDGKMATYTDMINVQQIQNQVKESHALIGKPKLFIYQGKSMTKRM